MLCLPLSRCCIIVGQSDRSYLCLHHWIHVTVQSVAVSSSSFSFVFSVLFFSLFLCLPVRERERVKFHSLRGPPCSPLGFIPLSQNTTTVWAVCFRSKDEHQNIDHFVWAKLQYCLKQSLSFGQNCMWRVEDRSAWEIVLQMML